jgi:hypothetical protein
MLIFLLLLPDWQLNRFISFAAFSIAFTPFILMQEIKRIKKYDFTEYFDKIINFKHSRTLLLLFVITLSMSVMILRFERNYYYGELTHPSETSSLSFFTRNTSSTTVAIISWRTAIWATYYNYKPFYRALRIWYQDIGENVTENLSHLKQEIDDSQYVMRGMRDEFTYGGSDVGVYTIEIIDDDFLSDEFNKIYSNSYYTIYNRILR